jgi:hypothetical protein
MPDVMGWYAFLLRHWVKPFLPLLYPGRRLAGLNFDGSPRANSSGVVVATGADRYLDEQSRAYKRFLSKLAIDVAKAAKGTVISRLQRMYDEVYVDEVQDLTGYDLDILEQLLLSTSTIRMVGDIRQSVFDTNYQDPRYKKYRGVEMLKWFEEQEKAGRLEIEHSTVTWRSVQSVASFSDTIFDSSLGFSATSSKQTATSAHDGVFALAPAHVAKYLDTYRPMCLRYSKNTKTPDGVQVSTFGLSKGLTHQRVLIFPTAPIVKFITEGTLLPTTSAFGLYVGVTRAVHSVAFVVNDPAKTSLEVWQP